MDIYGLFSIGNNDMHYEDALSWNNFIGIFTSVEEAKNYAEKKLNFIKENVDKEYGCDDEYDVFTIIEDWHWDDDRYKKHVKYPAFGTYDNEFVIEKLTINPEFKKEKYYY